MPSISAPTSQSLWPSAVGGITGAGVAEYTNKKINDEGKVILSGGEK